VRGQHEDVVEVLVASVGRAEDDHGVKLLSDDRFAAVSTDARRGALEEDRILLVPRGRLNRVSESDIDLQIQPRRSEQTLELDAEAVVLALSG
jgi:hypothetical protein